MGGVDGMMDGKKREAAKSLPVRYRLTVSGEDSDEGSLPWCVMVIESSKWQAAAGMIRGE